MPAQQFVDFAEGTLDLAGIDDTTTTITSTLFATLPVITGGDTLVLVIDPEEVDGTVETVVVTAHTASSTSVTVTRGAQGTSGSAHGINTPWIAPVTSVSLQEWEDHVDNQSNPHGVTVGQISAAPSSHVGAGGAEHADATGSVDGFMSAADKTKLDTIDTGARLHTAGAGIDIAGASIAHEDTSTQASVNNVAGTVIEDVTLDGFGHITGLASRNLSPADIGAETAGAKNQDVGEQHAESTAGLSTTAESVYLTATVTGLTSGRFYFFMVTGFVTTQGQTNAFATNVRVGIAGGPNSLLSRQSGNTAGNYLTASASYAGTFVASGTSQAFNLIAWRTSGLVPSAVSGGLDVICVEHP